VVFFFSLKNYDKDNRHTLLYDWGVTMLYHHTLHQIWTATLSQAAYAEGATMVKAREKSKFMNVLEGNILEDEVACDQFGYYSLL
jgi:hypothetical protein